jgi:hypothetical protein
VALLANFVHNFSFERNKGTPSKGAYALWLLAVGSCARPIFAAPMAGAFLDRRALKPVGLNVLGFARFSDPY